MRQNYKFPVLLIGLAVAVIPWSAQAVSSTTYQIDEGILSNHSPISAGDYDLDSVSFKLDAAVDPYTGSTTSTSFKVEAGNSFEYYCGDGFRDPTETCDGTQLNSATCASQGFDMGTLACSSVCAYDTSGCSNAGGGGGGGAGIVSSPTVDSSLTSLSFTYVSPFLLFGGKDAPVDSVTVNASATDVTYPTSTSWKKTIALSYGVNTFSLVAVDGGSSSETASYSIYRRLIGDVGQDNKVNDYDLSKFVKLWGGTNRSGDFNVDNTVNDYDFSMLVARWGSSV